MIDVPWSRAGSGFTLLFEAFVMALDVLGNTHNSVKKILVTSSRSIYGEGKYVDNYGTAFYPSSRSSVNMQNGVFELTCHNTNALLKASATDEESKIHPISIYGITKQYQEDMIMKIAPTLGIIPVTVRYQNVYGPFQSLSNPYTGILAVFSTRILNNNDIEIFEDGLESRDFVYIDDATAATILAMENPKANNEVFNVGTGVAIPVIDVVRKLNELYGRKVKIIVTGKYRVGDIRHNYADISKIGKILNFSPKIAFDHGIRLFADWVKIQEILPDNFSASIQELKDRDLYK